MNEEYLKVSELNRFIKDVLSAGFPQPVWVCARTLAIADSRNAAPL